MLIKHLSKFVGSDLKMKKNASFRLFLKSFILSLLAIIVFLIGALGGVFAAYIKSIPPDV